MALSFRYEKKFWDVDFEYIAGVDEVGRGPLAGPIVAAAVIFSPKTKIKGLNDSKQLTPTLREKLYLEIQEKALAVGIALLDHKMIDKINIGKANRLALKMAVEALSITPQYLLIDGKRMRIDLPIQQVSLVKGDGRCASIAAASIIAKVTRDRMMLQFHQKYPHYGFDRHKGYGTKEHFRKLEKFGPCLIHRRSFYPVSQY
ncbi:MAG: ribonuclease HII [Candidatus Margulisbacteria bacterium]|nr:ribonuclease HII [Candidatus Margulisiibacteriota bacterium]